jgi:hypothetical protein
VLLLLHSLSFYSLTIEFHQAKTDEDDSDGSSPNGGSKKGKKVNIYSSFGHAALAPTSHDLASLDCSRLAYDGQKRRTNVFDKP